MFLASQMVVDCGGSCVVQGMTTKSTEENSSILVQLIGRYRDSLLCIDVYRNLVSPCIFLFFVSASTSQSQNFINPTCSVGLFFLFLLCGFGKLSDISRSHSLPVRKNTKRVGTRNVLLRLEQLLCFIN